MLRAFADGALDQRTGEQWQVKISQHAVERHLKVTQGIDHGAV